MDAPHAPSAYDSGEAPSLPAPQPLSFDAAVPGVVHLDLLRAGLIPDYSWRDNERKLQWISECDWEYSREFDVPAEFLAGARRVLLRCEGLDTLAEVSVNGTEVLRADNMSRTWETDILSVLRPGANGIRVLFRSPVPMMAEADARRHYNAWNTYSPRYRGKSHLRKMPCSFGWDWGPMVATCGIWREISLVAVGRARLADVEIRQRHAAGHVDLELRPALDAEPVSGLRLRASATSLSHPEETFRAEGPASGPLEISVGNPRLWWPNDLGAQELYRVDAELLDESGAVLDAWSRETGLRTVELDRHPDEWGESFQFKVNGRTFFAKGADWIPADNLIPRLTQADYDRLLGSAADAHMNMIRDWGGGIYEQEEFFRACDRLGLLVWQDFQFACATYPASDPVFLANVEAEARDNIRRLRAHPSLAFLCGNNELEQGLVNKTGDAWHMSWAEYGTLFDDLLARVSAEEAPELPYWPGSPHTPVGDRQNSNDPASGDSHCWDVWFGGKPFEHQRTWTHRFMSEFGFQSFPELRTVEAFTEPGDRNLSSYVMDYHQRSNDGNRKIFAYLMDWFRLPEGLEETLWLTQITQAAALQYACEHARRIQPRMMGVVYWQINDIWPCASWSSIDSFGRWKALHYAARRFFAPLLVSLLENPERTSVEIHVSNHHWDTEGVEVAWRLMDTDGALLASDTLSASVPGQADRAVATVDAVERVPSASADFAPRRLLLFADLRKNGETVSSNVFAFAHPKHMELARPAFSAEWRGDGSLVLSCDKPALYVRLELEGRDAVFSDNFFALAPGDRKVVTVRPADGNPAGCAAALRVHSLVDSYS